jgi:hypothetical protein
LATSTFWSASLASFADWRLQPASHNAVPMEIANISRGMKNPLQVND